MLYMDTVLFPSFLIRQYNIHVSCSMIFFVDSFIFGFVLLFLYYVEQWKQQEV